MNQFKELRKHIKYWESELWQAWRNRRQDQFLFPNLHRNTYFVTQCVKSLRIFYATWKEMVAATLDILIPLKHDTTRYIDETDLLALLFWARTESIITHTEYTMCRDYLGCYPKIVKTWINNLRTTGTIQGK